MDASLPLSSGAKLTHDWLHEIRLANVPGPTTPLLEECAQELLRRFQARGHTLLPRPEGHVDALLTTAMFGEPINWRKSMLFTARGRYQLDHTPIVFTLVHITPKKLQGVLDYFETVLEKDEPDPADYDFPGLTPLAYQTLYEQGRRGGPILALVRLVQSQAMSIRNILVVGEDRPLAAYTFDLVGAHPRSDASDPDEFYEDLLLRILTAASTHEITEHQLDGSQIPLADWQAAAVPPAMRAAGLELGKRRFFTEMVRISNLVNVPAAQESVSSQYSEGCFATWDVGLQALVATVTGSARPVDKDKLSDEDLAVIIGVRPDGKGAVVRHVQGKRNDPPSSEAVELIKMDGALPKIILGPEWDSPSARVPVTRSKLHGHRGVKAFDPQWVEHVALEPAYYHYPVSCSTEAQAHAIETAFSRSGALNDPDDPRQVVFTVLPGHGVVIVEKWVPGKVPFQVIWEAMDAGQLEIDNYVPQGPLTFVPDKNGRRVLRILT
jgi:hypothetical protein